MTVPFRRHNRKRLAPPPGRSLLAMTAALLASAPLAPAGPTGSLDAVARQRARAEVKRCGKGYSAFVDSLRHVVYVSSLDSGTLDQVMRLLHAHATAFRREFPCPAPAWNIVVILPVADDYKRLVPTLKIAPDVEFTGIYQPASRRLTSLDHGRVLRHEFTHALHHADAAAVRQPHPIWVSEGLATLLENARIGPNGFVPVLDERLWTLQQALRRKETLPLADFLRMGQKTFLKTPDLSYAQARYLMLYLHHRQRLGTWYATLKREFSNDPSGRRALEVTLRQRLDQIEKDWAQWAAGLVFRGNPSRSGQGRLGLTMANDSRGVKVTRLLDGGSAKRAGRIRVGDVIRKFNGVETKNVTQLAAAIRAAGASRTVTVEILRHGRPQTLHQPLDAPK